LAGEAIQRADAETYEATVRGQQAALWPKLQPVARNLLVYGLATVVLGVVQIILLLGSSILTRGNPPTVFVPVGLCGLPVVAFVAGYITLATVGQPRIQTGPSANVSVKLGLLICFGGTWALWGLLLLVDLLTGH